MSMLRREKNEIFIFEDFITDVPSGATDTGYLDLPEGFYNISWYGTQTASSSAPTLGLETALDTARTRLVPIYTALYDDTAVAIATTLDVAKTSLVGIGVQTALLVIHPYVYVGKGGLKWTYTKNGGTAIRLSLAANRV